MPRFALIVQLHIDSEHRDDYERFEAEASRIMARHGGRIERRMATKSEATVGDDDVPDEVHLVSFPSPESFEAYRLDPALTPLAELRSRAIRRTIIWQSNDLPRFP
jgi:uncharacterized protein (DUF1330 family)